MSAARSEREFGHGTRLNGWTGTFQTAAADSPACLADELNQVLTAIVVYLGAAERLVGGLAEPDRRELGIALGRAAGQTARAARLIRQLQAG